MTSIPGRTSPPAYHYRPEDLAGPPDRSAATVFVAGGVYGNPYAAEAVAARARAEPGGALVVFNGDTHYLDADPATFARVVDALAPHTVTLGNIEYALGSGHEAVGCGCAYPDRYPDDVVACSNGVVERLRRTATAFGDHLDTLRTLPRWLVLDVGGHRVGIVHGDLGSVAGWTLALENLDRPDAHPGDALGAAALDVLCCTHTGLPYAERAGDRAVVNNGCAGLPCFTGRPHGVMTRVSADPAAPPDSLYGAEVAGLRVDALPVAYAHEQWRETFARTWPLGSPGHRGYARRVRHGPDHTPDRAARAGFTLA